MIYNDTIKMTVEVNGISKRSWKKLRKHYFNEFPLIIASLLKVLMRDATFSVDTE